MQSYTRVIARSRLAVRTFAHAPPIKSDEIVRGNLLVWGRIGEPEYGFHVPPSLFDVKDLIGQRSITTPMYFDGLHNVKQVACHSQKSLALTEDGKVYAWGTCNNFSLGLGNETFVKRPTQLMALDGIKIVQIAAGEFTSAAISEEGEVFTWGWGGSFWKGPTGLGHGNKITQSHPALVESLADAGVKIVQICVGERHMLALDSNGQLWSWGSGSYGRLGSGSSDQLYPRQVDTLTTKIKEIAAGNACSFALDENGDLFCWGANDASQLGIGAGMVMDISAMEEFPVPVQLEGADAGAFNGRVARIFSSARHALAITVDGRVWYWGNRVFLQPTLMKYGFWPAGSASPITANRPEDGKIELRAVDAALSEHTCSVVDAQGRVFSWGKPGKMVVSGLGDSHSGSDAATPTLITDLPHGLTIESLSLSVNHALAIIGIPKSL